MTQFPQLEQFKKQSGIVRLIGHRGARGVMPENTIEGFHFTRSLGVNVIEFDVVLSKDGVPVITHNLTFLNSATRLANGDWPKGPEPKVAELTLEQIKSFDVGGLDGRTEYGQRFVDQAFLSNLKVPTLEEFLQMGRGKDGRDLIYLLELKSDPENRSFGGEISDLVRASVNAVRKYGLEAQTVLHSFDWDLLEQCKAFAPEMPRSYLSELPDKLDEVGEDSAQLVSPNFSEFQQSIPQVVSERGGHMWCPYFKDVTPEHVIEAHGFGLPVSVWTVNEHDDIVRMIEMGVDGIVTDYPGRVQRILVDRELHWQA